MSRGAKRAVILAGVLLAAAILAIIALRPAFLDFTASGKQREVYANLGQLLEQQHKFEAELEEYLTVGPAGAMPGGPAVPWPNETCPSDCRGLKPEACTSFACLEFAPQKPVRYRYGCRSVRHGDAYDVTCAAAGDVDADGELSLLVVGTSTTGQLVAALPDLGVPLPETRCSTVSRVPSEVVYDCTPGEL